MKHKPIKIDWDELEGAFDNRDPQLVHYLDRITGHVHLEGEGEERDFKADESRYNRGEQSAPSQPEDATRAYIQPITTAHKLEWVGRFVEEVPDLEPELKSRLGAALGAENPAEAVLEVLNNDPEAKELWYVFRAERLHEVIEQWVEGQGISVSEPPPWK